MKQLLLDKKGRLKSCEVPVPRLNKGTVLVKTLYSVVSSGTELRSLTSRSKTNFISKLTKKFILGATEQILSDGFNLAYRKIKSKLNELSLIGYSSCGTVIDKSEDIHEISKGDIVVCSGYGYANHAEIVSVPKNLVCKVPKNVDPKEAAFATIAAIALHGVRCAEPKLGETALVIGLGLIGQFVSQFLKISGCNVICIDPHKNRTEICKKLSTDKVYRGRYGFTNFVLNETNGLGADLAVVCADIKETAILREIGQALRDKARIVAIGVVEANIPHDLFFKKELSFMASRSTGPGRFEPAYEQYGADFPIGLVRWTENRNVQQFLDLLSKRKINVSALISKEFELKDAHSAYNSLKNKDTAIGVIFKYDQTKRPVEKKLIVLHKLAKKEKIKVAVVGLGIYATNVLLPLLIKNKDYQLQAVVSSDGLRAKQIAEKFGATYCSTDYSAILKDGEIDLIFITTRNEEHAKMAIAAAKAKKAIFLEKPLALNESECREVINAIRKNKVFFTLGLNRRFSRCAKLAKHLIKPNKMPVMIHYRINEGRKVEKLWVEKQGGRLIHMACHVVDFCCWLLDSDVESVIGQNISSLNPNAIDEDNFSLEIKFKDGSLANLFYSTMGTNEVGRERVEIYTDNMLVMINDFKEMQAYGDKKLNFNLKASDKGHQQQLAELAKALKGQKAELVILQDSIRSAAFCFKALESLKTGQKIKVDWQSYY